MASKQEVVLKRAKNGWIIEGPNHSAVVPDNEHQARLAAWRIVQDMMDDLQHPTEPGRGA